MSIPYLNKSSGESIVSQFPVPVSLSLLVIVPASRADRFIRKMSLESRHVIG